MSNDYAVFYFRGKVVANLNGSYADAREKLNEMIRNQISVDHMVWTMDFTGQTMQWFAPHMKTKKMGWREKVRAVA